MSTCTENIAALPTFEEDRRLALVDNELGHRGELGVWKSPDQFVPRIVPLDDV